MNRRLLWALGLTLAATLYAGWQGEPAEEPPPVSPAPAAGPQIAAGKPLATTAPADAGKARPTPIWSAQAQASAAELLQQPVIDVFAPTAGAQPLPPQASKASAGKAAPASPAQDALPPLPLQEAGLWRDAQQRLLALNTPEGLIYICEGCTQPGALRKGDRLLGQYRIDAFTDTALTLTYLPLMRSQVLPLGARP